MPRYSTPLCAVCIHRLPNQPRCIAYPREIPEVFWEGEEGHTELQGDEEVEVVFVPDPELPAELVENIRNDFR